MTQRRHTTTDATHSKSSSSIISQIVQQMMKRILNKSIKDIMTSNVTTIDRDKELLKAAYIMIKHNIACVVVARNGMPEGVITESDFVRKRFNDKQLASLTVEKVMSKEILTIDVNATAKDAAMLMITKRIRKLPVVSKKQLVGIVTQTDIVRNMNNLISNFLINRIELKTAADIMTKPVATMKRDGSFSDAMAFMRKKLIGCVVIAENHEIIGMITEKDVLREILVNSEIMGRFKVSDVMTSPVTTIPSHFGIFHTNKLMIEKNFRRLPIIENHKLVGIVTQTDLNRAMYEFGQQIISNNSQKRKV